MPKIEEAIKYGVRLNLCEKAVFKAIETHQDYVWDLHSEHLDELQNFAEEQFGKSIFTHKQIRASVHKLQKKELIGRITIGTTSTANRTYPGRWHYGSHEACKLVEEQFRKEHREQHCEKCGTLYTPNRSDQKYCGEKCRSAISSKAYTARKAEQPICNTLHNTA